MNPDGDACLRMKATVASIFSPHRPELGVLPDARNESPAKLHTPTFSRNRRRRMTRLHFAISEERQSSIDGLLRLFVNLRGVLWPRCR